MRIRGFEPKDLDACYAISLATGLAGGDATHLYRDPRMMGHLYMAPYASLEPQLVFVVEDADGVAGFVAGSENTAVWEDRLEREWWPSLRRHYVDPSDVPPERHTADQRRASMIHRPTRTPTAVTGRYLAHLHMNLLPRLQRRGIGSRLLDTWLHAATRQVVSRRCQPDERRGRPFLAQPRVRAAPSRRIAGRTDALDGTTLQVRTS